MGDFNWNEHSVETIRKLRVNDMKGLGIFKNGKGVGLAIDRDCKIQLDLGGLKTPDDETLHLENLVRIYFWRRSITKLHPDIFRGLTGLSKIDFSLSGVTRLDPVIFTGLSQLQEINFHRNRLLVLPVHLFQGLESLVALNFSNNRLSYLKTGMFAGLVGLKKINFSHNQISHLGPGLFENLAELSVIEFKKNQLASFDKDAFRDLTNLTRLDFSFNEITHIDETLFAHTANLTEINFSNNRISQLSPFVFLNANKLEKINLSNNLITSLDADLFAPLVNLTEMYFASNRITSLDERIFSNNQRLKWIDFSDNQLTHLDPTIFANLSSLNGLVFFNNQLVNLQMGLFNGLTSLDQLDFSQNRINIIDFGVFSELVNLTELKLSCNQIINMDPMQLNRLPKLIKLDLSRNRVSKLSEDHFSGLTSLVLVDLSMNKISSLEWSSFMGLVGLREINFYKNRVSTLDPQIFTGLRSLSKINFSRNKISNLDRNLFRGLVNLTDIVFSSNRILELDPRLFSSLKCLVEVDFSRNQLDRLDPDLFRDLRVLSVIDFSQNKLTRIDAHLLKGLNKLTRVNFSSNQIEKLEPETFAGLTSLTEINMGSNRVADLHSDVFKWVGNLTKVDFSSNQLSQLDPDTFRGLRKLEFIDFSANKINRLEAGLFTNSAHLNQVNFTQNPIADLDAKLISRNSAVIKLDCDLKKTCQFTSAEELLNELYNVGSDGRVTIKTTTFKRLLDPNITDNLTPLDLILSLERVSNELVIKTIERIDSLTNSDRVNFMVTSADSVCHICRRNSGELMNKLTPYLNVSEFSDCFRAAISNRNEQVAIWLLRVYSTRINADSKYGFNINDHLKECSELNWWSLCDELIEMGNNVDALMSVFDPASRFISQPELIKHPIGKKLVHNKWEKIPRFVFQLHLGLKIMFFILYWLNLEANRGVEFEENGLVTRIGSFFIAMWFLIGSVFEILVLDWSHLRATSLLDLLNSCLCVANLVVSSHKYKPIVYFTTLGLSLVTILADLEKIDSIGTYISGFKSFMRLSVNPVSCSFVAIFSILFSYRLNYWQSPLVFNRSYIFSFLGRLLIESFTDKMDLNAEITVRNLIWYLVCMSYIFVLPRLILLMATGGSIRNEICIIMNDSRDHIVIARSQYVVKIEHGMVELSRLIDKYPKLANLRKLKVEIEDRNSNESFCRIFEGVLKWIWSMEWVMKVRRLSGVGRNEELLRELIDRIGRIEERMSGFGFDKKPVVGNQRDEPDHVEMCLKQVMRKLNKIEAKMI